MVKGEHGHAGTANRRVPSGPLSAESRKSLAGLLAEHGRVVAEPWDERLLDMSVNFTVEVGGSLRDFRGHQLLNSRDGRFPGRQNRTCPSPAGALAGGPPGCRHGRGQALDALGYFGPVSVDAYVRNTPEGPRLRPLVDINARHSMALPAYGLSRRLPGKTLLWMWSKPRKLDLPQDYAGLDDRLGPLAFQAASGTGILAASPLGTQGGSGEGKKIGSSRPKRVGFVLSARDEEELQRLQAGFARALGRS